MYHHTMRFLAGLTPNLILYIVGSALGAVSMLLDETAGKPLGAVAAFFLGIARWDQVVTERKGNKP